MFVLHSVRRLFGGSVNVRRMHCSCNSSLCEARTYWVGYSVNWLFKLVRYLLGRYFDWYGKLVRSLKCNRLLEVFSYEDIIQSLFVDSAWYMLAATKRLIRRTWIPRVNMLTAGKDFAGDFANDLMCIIDCYEVYEISLWIPRIYLCCKSRILDQKIGLTRKELSNW